MQTVTDNLRARTKALLERISHFLTGHCGLHRWNEPGSGIITFSDFAWNDLDTAAKREQSEILREYRRLSALLRALLREQPSDAITKLRQLDELVYPVIEQSSTTHFSDIRAVADSISKEFSEAVDLLDNLHDPSEGLATFIPDTNALVLNPSIESWRFADAKRFLILLTPTVLAELDSLKINYRVESVREKAQRLIRQIKEYRRRGRLTDGVPLAKDTSTLTAIALEPRVEETLPWLDSRNNDDRLLASVIEVMQRRPRSPVLLVTSDINLQNKAEFAEVPFVEPPAAELSAAQELKHAAVQ